MSESNVVKLFSNIQTNEPKLVDLDGSISEAPSPSPTTTSRQPKFDDETMALLKKVEQILETSPDVASYLKSDGTSVNNRGTLPRPPALHSGTLDIGSNPSTDYDDARMGQLIEQVYSTEPVKLAGFDGYFAFPRPTVTELELLHSQPDAIPHRRRAVVVAFLKRIGRRIPGGQSKPS